MMGLRLGWALITALSLGLMACGGDDDDGGGSGVCAHAKMLCGSSAGIDCGMLDSQPESVKSCVMNATTCDAVAVCALAGAAGSGG